MDDRGRDLAALLINAAHRLGKMGNAGRILTPGMPSQGCVSRQTGKNCSVIKGLLLEESLLRGCRCKQQNSWSF
ncbi:hypothetical protein PDJAM_G00203760 [Pangasius djambal]|uniref:Uncharacterized protein n=1 Tax=Pangasius djambal TaxID=1691987 RepID=A0ACC5Y8S5_9TELE|nr:hypothetical protein [Pangasius djambal]